MQVGLLGMGKQGVTADHPKSRHDLGEFVYDGNRMNTTGRGQEERKMRAKRVRCNENRRKI